MRNTLLFKQKQSLNISLKLWLPILQSSLQDLDDIFKKYSYENPFFECSCKNYSSDNNQKQSFIENTLLYEDSLYDMLLEQITSPLFPTPNSQKVAHEILLDIDDRGYFDGDIGQIATTCNVEVEFVETIRQRFSYLEPAGVGAKDLNEACVFQLSQLDIDDELYKLIFKMIQDFSALNKYSKHRLFHQAMSIIKNFRYVPSIEYIEEEQIAIPDFFIEVGDEIIIRTNNHNYPDISVNDTFEFKNDELKYQLKEARDLVGLLELRKSTLYKLILIIVDKQLSFFIGGELRPLTMKTVADEIGFEESTISRAVANKYIECSRGVFPLKHFFTNAVTKNISSSEIKNFIIQLVSNESHDFPMSDDAILEQVEIRFNLKMVRRTITKYRKLINIPSSKERKKLYKMDIEWTI